MFTTQVRRHSTFVSLDSSAVQRPISRRQIMPVPALASCLKALLSPTTRLPSSTTSSSILSSSSSPTVPPALSPSIKPAPAASIKPSSTSHIFPLTNTTAVITGGSRGIGLAVAAEFRRQGARVILIGRSHDSLLSARTNLISSVPANVPLLGGWDSEMDRNGVAVLEGDVSSVGEVEIMCKTIAQTYGPVETLINCAGISRDSILLSMDHVEASEVIATNLFGTINMSRGVAKGMMRRRKGCIINISSVLGLRGVGGTSVYSASKAGVVGFTQSLAKELGPKGIRVSSIAPGFIETDMTAKLTEQQRSHYLSQTPLGRFGSVEEVAHAAAFLAQAQYITGQTLVVDGGFSA
ncbi:hypothetical protein BDR26DRAFT_852153 [Obelidium mucronatum]|nr:hypothetical protein BDR26DRAFT_852153 [Obelidium mucronatum]